MLDRYIICDNLGRSPEADIPLLKQLNTEDRLGGAANVCHNLISLGLDVNLLAVCGEDDEGKIIKSLLDKLAINHSIITDLKRPTSLKSRTVDKDFKQFLRLDRESCEDVTSDIEIKILTHLKMLFSGQVFDAVVIQDYNKGLLTETIIRSIQMKCKETQIPLFVDPKKNHFELLSQCDYFKPNLKELSTWAEKSIFPNEEDLNQVISSSCLAKTKNIVITLAEKGLFYYGSAGNSGIVPGHKIAEADVSGAGDTVLSALVFAVLKDLNIKEIAQFANDKGAEVCRKPGVSTVSDSTIELD